MNMFAWLRWTQTLGSNSRSAVKPDVVYLPCILLPIGEMMQLALGPVFFDRQEYDTENDLDGSDRHQRRPELALYDAASHDILVCKILLMTRHCNWRYH